MPQNDTSNKGREALHKSTSVWVCDLVVVPSAACFSGCLKGPLINPYLGGYQNDDPLLGP